MKHTVFLGVFALLVTISITVNASPATAVKADGYVFQVGEQWQRLNASDESQVRKMTFNSTQGFAYSNKNFYAFNTPKDYMVLIYDVVYRAERPSLEDRVEQSKQRFDMGVSNGVVKAIRSNQITTVGELRLMETDWVGNTKKKNNRNMLYTINSPNKAISVNVSAFFPENDDVFANQVRGIVESIDFNQK